MLSAVAGCGGGGASSSTVKGILTDSFGAVIDKSAATLALVGSDVVGHPDSQGAFSLTVAPGTYTLTGVYKNTNAGISLKGQKSVTLVNGQTLDVGTFPLGNSTLEAGWDKYRNGSYTEAASSFKSYLDAVRSGQSTLGSTSAYSALGWTYGNGLDDPVKAMGYFHSAIDGWNGNSDAFAGLAGAELALLKADGIFHFNETIQGITSAIDLPGDYSSAPSHDMINEVDLKAFRAFANFLNGNTAGARSEASSIEASVNATGNDGSVDAIEIVLEFTK